MVGIKELKNEMIRVEREIKTAKGFRKKDLSKYHHRLWKELKTAEGFLQKGNNK